MNRVRALEQTLTSKLRGYTDSEKKEICAALELSAQLHGRQKRASGEPFLVHPVAVAEVLIGLKLDSKTVAAALLHDVLEDTAIGMRELEARTGSEVALLVDGVTKITRLKSKALRNAETIRKMFFAMVKDIRVILIKLADKLHNMRTLEYLERNRGGKSPGSASISTPPLPVDSVSPGSRMSSKISP